MRDRWSARLSVGVGAALLVGAAALGSWPGSPVGAGSVALQLLDIGAVLWAGAFVVGRRPENRVGVVLLLGGLAAALLLFLTYYADAALLAGVDIPGGIWALVGSQLLWPAVYFGLFVLLPLLLPDGTFLSPRWRRLAIALGALTLVAMVIAPLEPELVVGTMTVANPIGVVDPALVSPLDLTWTILFAAGLVAAAGSLVVRYRRSDAERRDQLRWVTAAIGLTLIVVVAQLVSDQFVPTLALPDVSFLVPLAAVPASIALSIARHRLFDIDLAIRRSLVFGALWLGIALAYASLAAALGLAAGRLSVQAAVLATIAATVLFQPARARLVRLADRLAYGSRAGAYEVLRDFGAATEGTIDVNDIGPRLAEAARRGMAAEWTRVVMGDASRGTRGLVLGTSRDPSGPAVLTVPLIRGKEVIGAIECGPRSEGEYRDRDRDVLATLGRQAALAIQNAGLTVDLARQLSVRDEQARELAASRARIVDAQEAERRRIERDIHDGVQQQLISLVAGVRLARNRLASDPEAAGALLQETQSQALAAIADLRELVRGIHPPVLEDAGLVPAIEAVTGRMQLDVTLDVDGLRTVRFPARIETAAYFVVCEALTNVMKHAGVEEARVTIRRAAGRLTVAVSDQGVGFVGEPTRGSGLSGLRDRLVAVGGELEVVSSPGAGSTVTAALPLDADG